MAKSQENGCRHVVRVLAALSDENRFRIVELLANDDAELSCGAIGNRLGLSPSLISHHLSILESAAIIDRRKNGLRTLNSLRCDVLSEHLGTLRQLIRDEARSDVPSEQRQASSAPPAPIE